MIRWHRLALEGFGRFAEPVEVTLGPGGNVLVAANEHGKSTLLDGWCAVLFGLAGGAGDTGFSAARYRSWYRAQAFRGALLLSRDQERFLVERDFDRQTVRLSREHGGRWVTWVEERHHAGVRRRGFTYQQALGELIGITGRELFEATFYLRQPLPAPGQLDAAVQSLLSGGGGTFEAALQQLEAGLREVTRFSAGRGVTSHNATQDRELERVKQQIGERRAELAQSREAVDSWEGLREARQQAEQRLRQAQEDQAAARRLAGAAGRWRELRDRFEHALSQQQAGARSLREALRLADQVREARGQVASYPEVAGTGPEAPEGLARLAAAHSELARLVAARQERAAGVARLEAAIEELGAILRSRYAGVRPGLVADYDRLAEAATRLDQEARTWQGWQAAREEAAAALSGLPDWGKLSPLPVAELRRLGAAARELLAGWGRLVEELEVLAGIQAEAFAGPAAREEEDEEGLAGAIEAQARAWESARAGLEQLQAAARAHPDLAGLEDPAAAREALWARLRAPRSWGPSRQAAAWALAGALLGGAAWLARGGAGAGPLAGAWAWALAGAVLLGGLALALRLVRRPGAGGPDAGPSLPPAWRALAANDLLELERRLSEHLLALRTAAALLEAPDHHPAPLGLRALRSRLEDRMAALAGELGPELVQEGRPVLRLAELRRRWGLRRDSLRSVARQLDAMRLPPAAAEAVLAGSSPSLAALAALPSAGLGGDGGQGHPWPGLLVLAGLYGGSPQDLGGLIGWLQGRGAEWWDQAAASAAAWEGAWWARQDLDAKLAGFGPGPLPERLEALASQVAGLRAAIEPHSLQTPRAELVSAWEEAEGLQRSLAEAREALARERGEASAVEAQIQALREAAAGLESWLGPLLSAAGGDLGAARRRLEEAARWEEALRSAGDGLAGILRSRGAASLEQLELDQGGLDLRAASASDAWDRLLEAEPALPSREAAQDPVSVDQAQKRIEAALRQADQAVEAAAAELASVDRQLARVEALGSPPNLVELSQELAGLLARERELEMRARGLALAHRGITAAVRQYQAAFRSHLMEAATRHFAALTGGGPGAGSRSVHLDEAFRVTVTAPLAGGGAAGPAATGGAARIDPAQLSRGAQDQLYVSLRLAVADLLSGRVTLPLAFDDPFLTFDQARTEAMRSSFQRLGQERQVLLVTHRPGYAGWGQPAVLRRLDAWPDWEVG